jgi:hypothetical protein
VCGVDVGADVCIGKMSGEGVGVSLSGCQEGRGHCEQGYGWGYL